MEEYIIKGPEHGDKYPAAGYQDVTVCMPVTVKAEGEVGKIETQCIGRPIITKDCDECPGKHKKTCTFTITQKIRVKVPVMFKVNADAGEAAVDCHDEKCHSGCEMCNN